MCEEYDQPLYVQGQDHRPRLNGKFIVAAKLPNFARFSCHLAQKATMVNVLKFEHFSLSVLK